MSVPSKMDQINVTKDDPMTRFKYLSKVGEGSYGKVYKAIDRLDNTVVAVKVMPTSGGTEFDDLAREINILEKCISPYIVAYRGTYIKNDQLYIAMEWCGVGSLSDLMAICDCVLTEQEISAIMYNTLQGLAYLHSNRKIHRDLKSGNILLTDEADSKLADFGVSAELSSTMAKARTMIGTPYFMAPEVLSNSEYDNKADIWSLGITAFELAEGAPPHADVHPMRALFIIPSSPAPRLPEGKYSNAFTDFVHRCLSKETEQRPTAVSLLTHKFITMGLTNTKDIEARHRQSIRNLLKRTQADLDNYRLAEQQDQETNNDYMPGETANETAGTEDVPPAQPGAGNMSTIVAPSGTLVAPQSQGTMLFSNETGTMISPAQNINYAAHNNNNNDDMSTMVITRPKQLPVQPTMGTVRRTGPTDTLPNAFATARTNGAIINTGLENHTIHAAQLFGELNPHLSLQQLLDIKDNINAMYDADIDSLNEWYLAKLDVIEQIIHDKQHK